VISNVFLLKNKEVRETKKEVRMSEAVGSKEEVSALARGLALLKAIGMAAAPMGNRDLADATGIPKATVSRLTATLVGSGYLRQSRDSERFTLGPALLDMSSRYLRHFDLRTVARPYLTELSEFAGASIHMGVRDELDLLVIDSLRPRSALISSRIEVGSRLSIATSAAGRAYLAALPEPEQAALLEQIRLETGENWPSMAPRLLAGIEEYGRVGYCSSFGDWHPHIHAIGFALQGPRGERYGVSCGGPAYLLPKETMLERVAPRLLDVAQRIAAEAGTFNPY
jgi:DNA-binding IclR family transcriptional regulator